MPTVNARDIKGAYVGTREAGALLMGNKLIWNRTAKYTRTNSNIPNAPVWATFFTAILVGGGAGGRKGLNVYGIAGKGGSAGDVEFVADSIHPGSSLSLVIGQGGAASPYNGFHKKSIGGDTVLQYRKYGASNQSTARAAGGADSAGVQHGEPTYITASKGGRYYSSHTGSDSRLTIGSAATRSGAAGVNGGGGSGGDGARGFFDKEDEGGRGGNGWFQIQFYGIDPTTPRLTGG